MKMVKSHYVKKFIQFLLIISMIVLYCPTGVWAQGEKPISIIVMGRLIEFSVQQPTIINSVTMVPVTLAEEFGYKVSENAETGETTISNDKDNYVFKVDSDAMKINGKTVKMSIKVISINSCTLVPLKNLTEPLGYEIKYATDATKTTISLIHRDSVQEQKQKQFEQKMGLIDCLYPDFDNFVSNCYLMRIEEAMARGSGKGIKILCVTSQEANDQIPALRKLAPSAEVTVNRAFVYEDDWRETSKYDQFNIENVEYDFINQNSFYNLYISKSNIELENCLIQDFSLEHIAEFVQNNDKKLIMPESNYINIELNDCYLLANLFSIFNNFKVKKLILNKCVIDIRRIDFINFVMDENSQFEFNECRFIHTEINLRNFKINNGHFVISDCIFSKCSITFEATLIDSNVFILTNSFIESRLYFTNSKFTNSAITISNDFKYSLNISFQTIYSNNSNLHMRFNNFLMKDKNILQFEDMNFEGGKFSFEYSNMVNSFLSFEDCKFNTYLNISAKECKEVHFSRNTINNGIIKINVNSGLNKLSFVGLINTGVIDIDWYKNSVAEAVQRGYYETYKDLANQFLILKDSYNKIGYYDYGDKAYVLYKRYLLKDDLFHSIKSKSIFRKMNGILNFLIKKSILDYIGEFGMNPIRIICFMIAVVGLFGCIYTFLPSTYLGGTNNSILLSKIYNSLYFSGITFLTIGYGDIHPLGIVKLLTVIEGFLGVLSMSYFIVSFSRKVIR